MFYLKASLRIINLKVIFIYSLSLNSYFYIILIKFVIIYIEFVNKISINKAFNAIIITFFSSAYKDIILWFCNFI
ncbi:hypothetical protein FOXYSP1_21126 [Fusarium oxysporum f. sp. phaseoli]